MKNIKRKRILAMTLITALSIGVLGGCSSKNEQKEPENSDPVVVNYLDGTNIGYHGFNPVNNNNAAPGTTFILENLFHLSNEDGSVQPFLAESYEHPDELTWVIKIREGIKFSNGEPLTAEAVKLSLDYRYQNAEKAKKDMNIKETSAEGQQLTIVTNDPNPLLPNILTNAGIFYLDGERIPDFDAEGIIGTGPYMLEEGKWNLDGNRDLARNDNYWQGTPAATTIHVVPISDKSATTLALQAREIDWATIQPSDAELFEKNSDYSVTEYDTGRLYFSYVNPNYTFTEDPALREALQYAFDRQAYIDGIFDGRGRAVTSIFPYWTPYYDEKVQQVGYDQDKAKQILKDAGYVDSDNDGILEKDGQPVKLNITTYDANSFPILSQAMQASLKEIGIDSEITIAEAIGDALEKGQFNLALYGHNTLTFGDSYNILSAIFTTDGYENYIGANDTELDKIVNTMQKSADADERAKLSIEAQKRIYESNNFIFLNHVYNYYVEIKEMQGTELPRFNSDYIWKVKK